MTNNDLQQAKEWVTYVNSQRDLYGDKSVEARAAARVIQSLPDEWIDAEELRELVVKYEAFAEDAEPEGEKGRIRAALYRNFVGVLEALLLTPNLPTLAELIEAGDKPEGYQWMQAQVFPTASVLGIITGVDGYTRSAIILFADGMAKNVPWAFISPRPDLPKLEWPGDDDYESEYCPVCGATLLDDGPECEHCREDASLPRPEDVPAGEAWLILCNGHEWVGTRDSRDDANYPWALSRLDGIKFTSSKDLDITLVSRLVPEVKP